MRETEFLDELIHNLSCLRTWKQGGFRAPHKPLLLLYALGQLCEDMPVRLVPFSQVESPLRGLLMDFGPPRKSFHPEYPFYRLTNDGIWELHGAEKARRRKSSSDYRKSELLKYNVKGGFTKKIYDQLSKDDALFRQAVRLLLDRNFPTSIHGDILQAVGIDPAIITREVATRRDPEFRERVLHAYEYQCAICGFNFIIGDAPAALEAAHIKWHQAGGPDTEDNGLALCSLHHKLFDRGAFSIDRGRTILVSQGAHGTCGFEEWLLQFHGKKIRSPQASVYFPKQNHTQWHMREVFQSVSREFKY